MTKIVNSGLSLNMGKNRDWLVCDHVPLLVTEWGSSYEGGGMWFDGDIWFNGFRVIVD